MTGVSRQLQSWATTNLRKFSNLQVLELSGSSIDGPIWVTRPFPTALTNLKFLNTDVTGQVPAWVWEVPRLQFTGNSRASRELPAAVSSGPQQCTIDTDDYWVCPIPMWAEVTCSVNVSSCLTATSAPTPMPTPPTQAPTPAPTPAEGDCLASLVPCPDLETSTTFAPECAMAGFSCQWTCCLRNCTVAYTSDMIDMEIDNDYSCAQVIGAPQCSEPTGTCRTAWAPTTAAANGSLDIGFNQQVFGEALIVVMNLKPGFVRSVEIFDYSTRTWVPSATFMLEPDPTVPVNRTLARFPVPGHLRTDRIRINTTTIDDMQEIDGILLIGRNVSAPTLMPTPAPPACLPPVELLPTSPQLDDMLADRQCINSACQWSCRLLNCTDTLSDCANVLGQTLSTYWYTTTGTDEVIELTFGLLTNATALVVIEAQIGSSVLAVDVFLPSNSSYVSAFAGTINATLTGAEVYPLRVVGEPINRVRIRFSGYRRHEIAAIRIVGSVPPRPTPMPTRAPQLPTPRLPGQFRKTSYKISKGRFDVLAQNNPAPVIDDVVYVPPGYNFTSSGFFTSRVPEFDRCNTTTGVCSRYTGSFDTISPVPSFLLSATAAMRVGGERVLLVAGSRLEVNNKIIGDIFWRTDSAPEWLRLTPTTARHETCVVAVPATGEFYMGGGREAYNFNTNLLLALATIERISFVGGAVESIRSTPLAFRLSQARAEPGCNVVGRNKTLVMYAGGRFIGDKGHEPSDVVDILDVITQTLTASRLSHKAVAVTVASVGSLVMVTGGSPTCGPPQCGIDAFRYTNYDNLGVDRYDVDSAQWQYLPYVLTEGVQGGVENGRVPVTVASRFIAVVAGIVTLRGDGGSNYTQSPIDLFDTYTGLWHRNVLQHHALRDFMVAGVGNRLLIIGGQLEGSGSAVSDQVTAFEWEPYPYTLIDCGNSQTCTQCLSTNAERHYEPCRWCEPQAGVGLCILDTKLCPPMYAATLTMAQNASCPTPNPTPVPRVRYFRLHRFVLARDFAQWNFTAFATELAAHLGCQASALSEFAPAQNGSVIAYIKHEEQATASGAQYDERYRELTTGGAPSLAVTNLTLLPQDFTLPPTAMPPPPPTTPSTAPTTTTLMSVAAPAPTPEDLSTLYIIVGVIAGLLVLLLIGCLLAWLVQRNRRAVAAARRDGELSSATQYELANRSVYDQASPSGRVALTVTGTGQIAEKYLLLARDIEKGGKLGEGAFGVVYKGRWRNIEVAIKEVKYEAMSDPAQIASLEQEAVKMANMRAHQNVVQLYGLVQHPLSIVVEFCAKGALDDWLRSDDGLAASTTQLLKIVNGIAKGVAHLHAENIIHRDLAARNILLSEGLLPKVADFGMSRDNQGEDKNQTKSHVGPLKWMAPEQLLKQQYSRASDVFAFGVVIYETLSGREPWEGLPNTAACFAARDHQLLTSAGFLFLDELLARVVARRAPSGAVDVVDWRGLTAATFDAKRGALVYRTPRRLVVNRRAPQAVVAFSDAAARIDIVATTNHEMYAERGGAGGFRKHTAAELANVRRQPVRFLAAAPAGVAVAGGTDAFLAERFGVRSAAERVAFLEAYGRALANADGARVDAWALTHLDQSAVRSVLAGWRQVVDAANASYFVATVEMRDDLMRLLMHAGYAPSFAPAPVGWCVRDNDDDDVVDETVLARTTTINDSTWCLDMSADGESGFVVVRRAQRAAAAGPRASASKNAVVVRSSRATIQGNCHKVLNGERLPVPARAPAPLGDLMRLCFETEPDVRPTMDDACRRIERIVAEAEDADGDSKRERRKSTKRKSKTLGQSMPTDYDEPDVSSDKLSTYNALPTARDDDNSRRLAVSDAYSLAPDPRAENVGEAVGAYEAAPPAVVDTAGRAAVAASAPANDTLTDDGAYSTPDIPSTHTASELQRSAAATPAVAPAVAKLSEKDQARLWRLSKKYEPKSEPPALTATTATAQPSPLTTTDSGRVTGTLQPTGLSDQYGPLPEGWRCAISPKSGRVYYYKKGEKDTSWVRPTA
jgi:serine/threonine protein kinase